MASRGHELLEHTADVGLRIWAPTLEGLFEEAAIGLIDVMGATTGTADRTERVTIDAPELDALFVDWLSDVLFLFDARGFVTRSVAVKLESDPSRIVATLHGADASGFVQHGPAVKAITYHGLEVAQTQDGYEARVYVDV